MLRRSDRSAAVPLGGLIKLSALAKTLVVDGAAEYLRQGVYAPVDAKYSQVRAAAPALDLYYQTTGYARSPGGANNVTFLDTLALTNGTVIGFVVLGDQSTRGYATANFGGNGSSYWDMQGNCTNLGGTVLDGVIKSDGSYGLLGGTGGLAQVNYASGGTNVGTVPAGYAIASKPDDLNGLVLTASTLTNGSPVFYSVANAFSAPTTTALANTTGLDGSYIYHLGWFATAGLWVAVGYKTQAADSSWTVTLFTSANGKDWTARAVPADFRLQVSGSIGTFPSSRGVSVNGAYLVCVNNAILRTTDGVTWTRVALPTGDLGLEQSATATFAMSAVGTVAYARYIGATPQTSMGYYSTDGGVTWKALPRAQSSKTGGTTGILMGRIWSQSGKTYALQKSASSDLGPFEVYSFPVAPHLAATHFGEPANSGFHTRIK